MNSVQKAVRSAAVVGLAFAAMGTGTAQASTTALSGDVSIQESCPSSGQIGYAASVPRCPAASSSMTRPRAPARSR